MKEQPPRGSVDEIMSQTEDIVFTPQKKYCFVLCFFFSKYILRCYCILVSDWSKVVTEFFPGLYSCAYLTYIIVLIVMTNSQGLVCQASLIINLFKMCSTKQKL